MCSATLGGFPGGLVCTRDHDDRGHTFESTSATDDRHDDGGHG